MPNFILKKNMKSRSGYGFFDEIAESYLVFFKKKDIIFSLAFLNQKCQIKYCFYCEEKYKKLFYRQIKFAPFQRKETK
jgi:hypothetical protein